MLLKTGSFLVKSSSVLSSSYLPHVFPAASQVLCSVTSNSFFCTSPGSTMSWKHLSVPGAGVTLKSRARTRRGSPHSPQASALPCPTGLRDMGSGLFLFCQQEMPQDSLQTCRKTLGFVYSSLFLCLATTRKASGDDFYEEPLLKRKK